MDVRRNSKPAFRSCLPHFQPTSSTKCVLVSWRARGSPDVVPSCEKKLLAPLGVTETRTIGKPESCTPLPWQSAVSLEAQRPIELGWNDWSCAKNPSEKRFQ